MPEVAFLGTGQFILRVKGSSVQVGQMWQVIFLVKGSSVQLGGIDSARAGALAAMGPEPTLRMTSKASKAVLDMMISSGTGLCLRGKVRLSC